MSRPLSRLLVHIAEVISVFCKLYNFIIDNNARVEVPPPSGIVERRHVERACWRVYLHDGFDLGKALAGEEAMTLLNFVKSLQ